MHGIIDHISLDTVLNVIQALMERVKIASLNLILSCLIRRIVGLPAKIWSYTETFIIAHEERVNLVLTFGCDVLW